MRWGLGGFFLVGDLGLRFSFFYSELLYFILFTFVGLKALLDYKLQKESGKSKSRSGLVGLLLSIVFVSIPTTAPSYPIHRHKNTTRYNIRICWINKKNYYIITKNYDTARNAAKQKHEGIPPCQCMVASILLFYFWFTWKLNVQQMKNAYFIFFNFYIQILEITSS